MTLRIHRTMHPRATLLALLTLAASLSAARAHPGDLDSTFGSGGRVTVSVSHTSAIFNPHFSLQADGKILVGALTGGSGAQARLTADGALDSSFGTGGIVTSTSFIPSGYSSCAFNGILLPGGDGLVLLGEALQNGTSNLDLAVAMVLPSGAHSGSFGNSGVNVADAGSVFDTLFAGALQPDGRIVVVGTVGNGSSIRFLVARYMTNGFPDTNFGTSGHVIIAPGGSTNATAYAVAVQPDGKILVGGYASLGGIQKWVVLRYTAAGVLDTSFGSSGIATIPIGSAAANLWALAVQPDGRILAAGSADNGSGLDFALARLTASGALDSTFGSGGKCITALASHDDEANCIAIQPDGGILLGGYAKDSQDVLSDALVRYTAAGALDTGFGSGGHVLTKIASLDGGIRDLALQSDGRILAAAEIAPGSGIIGFGVLRYRAEEPPTVAVDGKHQIKTAKSKIVLHGAASGLVTSVTVQLGRKIFTASGSASWQLAIKLKQHRNTVTIIAHGPGGDSEPVKVTIIRR
jgi:uncharacterized delta-60 repeat protein